MEVTKQRKIWIDYARAAAILCVVLCHAAEACYGPVVKGKETLSPFLWIMENTLFTVGRLGVPLFIAITGTLLVGREYRPRAFYRRSLLPLWITTEIWILLNYLFVCIFQKEVFSVGHLLCELLFLRTPELSHMWYMPMILGMYAAMPFLAYIPLIFDRKKDYLLPAALAVLAFLIIPTIGVFLKEAVPGSISISMQLDLGFLGGVYGLYLFTGYFVGRRGVLKRVQTKWLIAAMSLAFLFNTAGQYFLYSHQYYESNRLLWYTSFFIYIMGMTAYELIRRSREQEHKLVTLISKCSFGIYLLHKPIQVLLTKYLPMKGWNDLLQILLLLLAGMGLSILILLPFYHKWQKVGKILFFIKK